MRPFGRSAIGGRVDVVLVMCDRRPKMIRHAGGCLCGRLRYETSADPVRVTICHCRFCQRATGSAYMVEPLFREEDVKVTTGAPSTFALRSKGSGKTVTVHFCAGCGTKIWLSFERFPGILGLYAGTFDDPNWFEIGPDNAKQIFIDAARPDSILMPGINVFGQHATLNDGTALEPVIFDAPHAVGRKVTR
jgi:hypothetical protein